MRVIKTNFQSGDLSLEGVLHIPEGDQPFPGVIVCHPHPQYGGSMDNNVVNAICAYITARSFVSFKFNFRGVGGSQGTFGNGIGEQEDADSAISFVAEQKEIDPGRLGIAGYSAGSAWGFNAGCRNERIKVLSAVSPPLSMFDNKCLQSCLKPKMVICGTTDQIIPLKPFLKFCESLPEPKECQTIKGADHSWWGYEQPMAETVAGFFDRAFHRL